MPEPRGAFSSLQPRCVVVPGWDHFSGWLRKAVEQGQFVQSSARPALSACPSAKGEVFSSWHAGSAGLFEQVSKRKRAKVAQGFIYKNLNKKSHLWSEF